MSNVKKVLSMLLVLVMMLAIITPASFAQDVETSGEVDSVLIKLAEGKIVSVLIEDYGMMYVLETGALYDYLANEEGNLDVYGVVSGDKYIILEDYGMAYILNDNDVVSALEEAEAIDVSEVAKFKDVNDIAVNLVDLKIGESEIVIDGNQINVLVPKIILNNPIGDLEITFTKPVKFYKINGKPLLSAIEDKLCRSGYDPEKYYNNFRMKTGWTYNDFMDLGDEGNISVVTEDGYTIILNIKLYIE